MSENGHPHDDTTTHERAALAADLRTLLRTIEAVHPDPFVGYESRVALHERVERLVRSLPEEATTEAFYRRAAPVVAGLDDAHSLLSPPEGAGPDTDRDRRLPVSLRVVGEELYVESVADEGLADLVGARLLAVEGVSVSEIAERGRRFRGSENRYGALDRVAHMIERHRPLARLLDRDAAPETPTLSVDVGDGERSRSVEPVSADRESVASLDTTLPLPEGSGPRYRRYGDGAAVFVPGNLSDYRESLEAKHAAAPDVAAEQAAAAHDRQVGGDRPDDAETTIAALPSMAETVEAMCEAMAAAGTETLVVDLRDNPGGDSQFVFLLAYALQGIEGLVRATEQVRLVRRRTDPYRERYGDAAGEGQDGPDNPMAYDFTGFLRGSGEEDRAQRLALVRQRLGRSPTATDLLDRVDDGGVYCPERLVVVTSAGTMSSAFAAAAQLTSLGADVVGVPSGQAPRSFGEPVERTLPNTGLDVRLAGSLYHWTEHPGDVLEPDRELTPERFERLDRAADAGLRLALEHAGHDEVAADP